MKRSLLVCACIFMSACFAASQRLPEIAVAESYKLSFTPDLKAEKFTGDETLNLRVLKPTSQIVLNAIGIDFQEVTITSGQIKQTGRVKIDPDKEQATIEFDKQISAGPATLHITYIGTLNHELRGFYIGKQDNGQRYAATQFEATDARRAFPCFDEPADKATFEVSIVADKGLTVISNTRQVADTAGPGDGKRTVRFARTAKMSPYLVAFVIGNFEYSEGSADGILIRMYTSPGKKDLGRFAIETAENALHYFDHYFGIRYPFEKLDMIALSDFGPGAMENTACITSRESFILLDEKHTGLELKKFIASVITHEIAHQWFGDLVTMQWWDDIWLNEGFATWMSSKPIEAWKPDWHIELNDVNDATAAMNSDSLENTHPIHQEAQTPAQILELADAAITYDKTAAVLRMVESYLGEETFRRGVNSYLKQHAYGNAASADFWNALSKASNKPVDKIMATFVEQPGPPMVLGNAKCAGASEDLALSQRRYVFDRAKFENGNSELWQIPVCRKDGPARAKCELLTSKEQNLKLQQCTPWIYLNAGAHGYYRSAYDEQTVRALAKDAEQALSPAERIMLQADVWASVRVDRGKIGDYLAVAKGLASDHTPEVNVPIVRQLDFIGRYLVSDADQGAYRTWVRDLLAPIAKQVGWQRKPGESADEETLRASLLFAMGSVAHDADAEAAARKIADQALDNPMSVEAPLAAAALPIAAANGDEVFYDKLIEHLKTAHDPAQKDMYEQTLTAFHDPKLLERTLHHATSETRSQDSIFIIARVMRNPAGQKMAWNFVRSEWNNMDKQNGAFGGGSAGAIVRSTSSFCDAASLEEVQSFFASHPVAEAERTLKQSLEQIGYCIDMKNRQGAELATWLKSESGHAAK
jgi:aminopeptidase N